MKKFTPRERRIQELYGRRDYLEAYSRHTDLRVEKNPERAVGGDWERLGWLQFEFLKNAGLKPTHALLDIGCGTLRGGRHFIRYLDAGNYYGMDISRGAIRFAAELVSAEGLTHKRPTLLVNENADLKFGEFANTRFDFILAQSVFTHLGDDSIEECFSHIGSVMHRDSRFYFTFSPSEKPRRVGFKDFSYPFSFFEKVAGKNGFALRDCAEGYPHPKGQIMVEARIPAPLT